MTAAGGNGDAGNLTHEYSVWTYDSNVTFDAKAADIIFNGDVEVVKHGTADSTLTLKSNTEVKAGTDSAGSLKITGTTMNLTDNLSTLTVADKTTLKGSTVYFYDDNDQADKYNGLITVLLLPMIWMLPVPTSSLCVPTPTEPRPVGR